MKEGSHVDKVGRLPESFCLFFFFVVVSPGKKIIKCFSCISSINIHLQINISSPGHGGFGKQHIQPRHGEVLRRS